MRLSWNLDDDGVITVYAHASDGRRAAVADFWVRPLIEKFGMDRSAAKDWQHQFADLLVASHNRLFTEATGSVHPKPSGVEAMAS